MQQEEASRFAFESTADDVLAARRRARSPAPGRRRARHIAAQSDDPGSTGGVMDWALDPEAAARLWDLSEGWVS